MGASKGAGKTIGEVEKLTGIPKRKIKYFLEQGLMKPTQKSESGYWLYNEEDIQSVQLISLCCDLDFPMMAIRTVLAEPDVRWHEELKGHITRLAETQSHTRAQLEAAKLLLKYGVWEALQIYNDHGIENRIKNLLEE